MTALTVCVCVTARDTQATDVCVCVCVTPRTETTHACDDGLMPAWWRRLPLWRWPHQCSLQMNIYSVMRPTAAIRLDLQPHAGQQSRAPAIRRGTRLGSPVSYLLLQPRWGLKPMVSLSVYLTPCRWQSPIPCNPTPTDAMLVWSQPSIWWALSATWAADHNSLKSQDIRICLDTDMVIFSLCQLKTCCPNIRGF